MIAFKDGMSASKVFPLQQANALRVVPRSRVIRRLMVTYSTKMLYTYAYQPRKKEGYLFRYFTSFCKAFGKNKKKQFGFNQFCK